MAQLVKAPEKYSPFEWHNSNRQNYNNAESERACAERLQVSLKEKVKKISFLKRTDYNFPIRVVFCMDPKQFPR